MLGNFIIPMMIGARDVAFPKLNLLSWYLFIVGGFFAFMAIVHRRRGHRLDFLHALQHALTRIRTSSKWRSGIFIAGFSSIITGMNFIITIQKMRAPGLTWFRLPLFIWSMFATSIILVLATPVLAITLALMAVERIWGVGIFNPKLGGDPILFQHLFWFYSHPAVYIMILPGMGVVSEVITCFSRKKIFGYHFIAFSSVAIAVLGFLVWGHHMFVSSQSHLRRNGIFHLKFSRRRSVGDQSFQLDDDACIAARFRLKRRCFMFSRSSDFLSSAD